MAKSFPMYLLQVKWSFSLLRRSLTSKSTLTTCERILFVNNFPMEEIFNSHTRTRARTHTIDLHSIRTEKSRISDRELAKQRKNERMTKRAACTKENRVMKYPSVRELNSRETFTMLGDRVCQRTCRPVKPKEFCRSSSVTATSLNLHTKRFIVKDENNLDMSLCFVCATRSLFFFFFFLPPP